MAIHMLRLKRGNERESQIVTKQAGPSVWFEKEESYSPKGDFIHEMEWDWDADEGVKKLFGTSASELLSRHAMSTKGGTYTGVAWIPLREGLVKMKKQPYKGVEGVDRQSAMQLVDDLVGACNKAIATIGASVVAEIYLKS